MDDDRYEGSVAPKYVASNGTRNGVETVTDYPTVVPLIDPLGGLTATPKGGVYNNVWTRDTFFALLGIADKDRRKAEYQKFAERLWTAKDADGHLPYMFGSTIIPLNKSPRYADEKTSSPVVDSNAIGVLAAVLANNEGLVNKVGAALGWYTTLRHTPDGLVYEGAAASWEDSLQERTEPVAYTNALIYAAAFQLQRFGKQGPTRKHRRALWRLVDGKPCAVSIGILVEWGGFATAEFDDAVGRLRATGKDRGNFQDHNLDPDRRPLPIMELVNMGGYHTTALWPWTQLFLAACIRDTAMGRPWADVYEKTGKLYETYTPNGGGIRPFWWGASPRFAMGLGCLAFCKHRTGRL